MSVDVDAFSVRLLDEAKRFLEKAAEGADAEQDAYLHAALIVGFSALESHVNGIADELSERPQTDLLTKSILKEKQVQLTKGEWALGSKDQYFRLEERISFLLHSCSRKNGGTYAWWSDLVSGIKARNALVHPRDAVQLTSVDVQRYLNAIIDALNDMYLGVFGKGHPSFNRGLQSTMNF
jgi:hypothetical protein